MIKLDNTQKELLKDIALKRIDSFQQIDVQMFKDNKLLNGFNLTDKGIAYAIAEANVLFTEYLQISHTEKLWENDMKKIKNAVITNDGINLYYHSTFKTYIEWNWFDELGNFKTFVGHQATKFSVETLLKIIEIDRIPVSDVLAVVGIPKMFSKTRHIDKEGALVYLKQMHEHL